MSLVCTGLAAPDNTQFLVAAAAGTKLRSPVIRGGSPPFAPHSSTERQRIDGTPMREQKRPKRKGNHHRSPHAAHSASENALLRTRKENMVLKRALPAHKRGSTKVMLAQARSQGGTFSPSATRWGGALATAARFFMSSYFPSLPRRRASAWLLGSTLFSDCMRVQMRVLGNRSFLCLSQLLCFLCHL